MAFDFPTPDNYGRVVLLAAQLKTTLSSVDDLVPVLDDTIHDYAILADPEGFVASRDWEKLIHPAPFDNIMEALE